jgi:copper chaperone CopZ
VISALVPDDFFAPILGGGIISMLILMAAGIPVYVCATASVPIAAALIAKGVSPGAALVFLMTGPATNAATIGTVWKIMGKRTAVIYLLTVAGSAIAAGLLLDYFFVSGSLPKPSSIPWMIPGYIKTLSGIVLAAVLLAAVFRRSRAEVAHIEKEGTISMKIRIEGMTCHHCAATVKRALLETGGVESAEVDHRKGIAYVSGGHLDTEKMKKAVEEVGYVFAGVMDD